MSPGGPGEMAGACSVTERLPDGEVRFTGPGVALPFSELGTSVYLSNP